MSFRTTTELTKSDLEIDHQSKILMLGSCFTTNIGQKLIDNKFDVDLNPFGVLYNPLSIRNAIDWLKDNNVMESSDLFEHNGLYHSFYHHSCFSGTDETKTLERINSRLRVGQDRFRQIDILFITFGTSYAFEHKESKDIVSNCHKLPASNFNRYRLTKEDIVVTWTEIIQELQQRNQKLKIIFTVSPIRHLSDGMHENQLSKATLLLSIDSLCQNFENVEYFPSYEIMLDDLRDYRFYADDMIHPSNLAIEYIWDIFKKVYLAKDSEAIIAEWEKIKQAINHRPFNERSEEHKHFLKQTLLKLNKFGAKYSYLLLDSERVALETKINN